MLVKQQLKAIDQEFFNALNQAIYLGPWEKSQSVPLVKIAVNLCNSMPRAMQKNMVQFINNSVMENRDELSSFLLNNSQKCKFAFQQPDK
ncbi:MAG: hypothetical protein HQL68_05725 [Magnetococcales bacterium]|nr:hypothetical protein [Magnetococcales bacterium]